MVCMALPLSYPHNAHLMLLLFYFFEQTQNPPTPGSQVLRQECFHTYVTYVSELPALLWNIVRHCFEYSPPFFFWFCLFM